MPLHPQSGLSLYPFRPYDPVLQQWLQRDPIGENGGINLYGFVGNNPIGRIDPRGLAWYDYIPGLGPGIAQAQGTAAMNSMLSANGYNGMQDFQQQHPGFGGTIVSGNPGAISGVANIAGGSANLYVNGATMLAQAGIVTKGAQAAAQGIADAAGEGCLSKLWGRITGGKPTPSKPPIGGAPRDCIAHTAEHLAASLGMDTTRVEALRDALQAGQNVARWQDAVALIEQATKLKSGAPVAWERAGPGNYAVFTEGHVVYGFVPPSSPNLFPYVFDAQLIRFYEGEALSQFSGAVAVPFGK
jgi:RHS repeat-associated protein